MEKGRLNVTVLRVVRVIIRALPHVNIYAVASEDRPFARSGKVCQLCLCKAATDEPGQSRIGNQAHGRLAACRLRGSWLVGFESLFLAPGHRSSLAVSVSEKWPSPGRYWCV